MNLLLYLQFGVLRQADYVVIDIIDQKRKQLCFRWFKNR